MGNLAFWLKKEHTWAKEAKRLLNRTTKLAQSQSHAPEMLQTIIKDNVQGCLGYANTLTNYAKQCRQQVPLLDAQIKEHAGIVHNQEKTLHQATRAHEQALATLEQQIIVRNKLKKSSAVSKEPLEGETTLQHAVDLAKCLRRSMRAQEKTLRKIERKLMQDKERLRQLKQTVRAHKAGILHLTNGKENIEYQTKCLKQVNAHSDISTQLFKHPQGTASNIKPEINQAYSRADKP